MLQSANLALAFILELCAVVALGYWGFQTGDSTLVKWLLGIGAPVLLIVIWGGWLAPKSTRRLRPPVLHIVKLIVFGTAAFALYRADQPTLALIFAIVMVINIGLGILWKQEELVSHTPQ